MFDAWCCHQCNGIKINFYFCNCIVLAFCFSFLFYFLYVACMKDASHLKLGVHLKWNISKCFRSSYLKMREMVILKNISGKSCWESSNAFPFKKFKSTSIWSLRRHSRSIAYVHIMHYLNSNNFYLKLEYFKIFYWMDKNGLTCILICNYNYNI